jgi:N-acetylglutamate synthase-like GNAT family acetyltransferase
MNIREAETKDLPELLQMGKRFREETAYQKLLGDNPAQMKSLAEQLLAGPTAFILVAENGGGLEGMIGVLVYPHYLSGELVGGEVFWWVNPKARGTMGIRLMREAEKKAMALGAMKMQMIAPTERVAQIYERLGYERVETTYQRSLA